MTGESEEVSALATSLLEKVGSVLKLPHKEGVLLSSGGPEPSVGIELWESPGKNRLTGGWSMDLISTPSRGGIGIAKDILEIGSMEVDVGGYATQGYQDLIERKFSPRIGLGIHARF